MGYFINGSDIAKATIKPAKVSLAGNPNYIQLESNAKGENKPVEVEIEVIGKGFVFNLTNQTLDNFTKFTIVDKNTGESHVFEATTDIAKAKGGIYYVGPWTNSGPDWSLDKIAEALKNALLNNSFIGSKFNITQPTITDGNGNTKPGTKIKLQSKGYGENYAFTIIPGDEWLYTKYINVIGNPLDTYNNDSIALGFNSAGIHLDMYKDTGIFLGEDDTPSDSNMGTKAITLTKAYSYTPLWFNTNILENNTIPTTFLKAEDWVDTGTIKDFRFTAKRVITDKTVSHTTPFYHSPVLYSIAGYNRTLEKNDLSDYVFDTKERLKNPEAIKRVKTLTNQPQLFHIKGQTQYFNFILSDAEHSKNIADEYRFGICYELLSQSGQMVAKETKHLKARKDFFMVNTIKLDIDSLLHQYPNTGLVRAYLIYSGNESQAIQISHELTFGILPECLYKVKDFAFLNRLGGWSSFNFSGTEHTDFKTEANTIFKTQTPHFTTSSDIESVYSKTVTEQFTVQTMPLRREVCNWLKEMSASRMVYELATQRYIIVVEMNIKPNSKDELYRVEMKYHYSDSYN